MITRIFHSRKAIVLLVAIFTACMAPLYSQALGDVNSSNSIDIVDALLVAQYYVGLNPGNFTAQVADVNCSGGVDIVDALLIAQLYVGLISQFPCSQTAGPTQPGTPAPTAAPTPGPTGSGVQNKTARVFWLKPSDVAYDQKIVDGIAGVMLEAQTFYKQELGVTFHLNNPIVEVVYGDHPKTWYETNNPGGDPVWYTTTNLRDELIAKYGVEFWDTRWKVIGYISAEGNGCGPHGWVLLPKHDTDGAAGYRTEPMSRWYGGMVHELGHAFDLPDAASTDGTPMSASFYDYPNCHFNDAQKNTMLTSSRNSGYWFTD